MRCLAAALFVYIGSALAAPIHRDRGGTLLIGDSMMRVGVGPVLRRAIEEQFGPPVDLKAKASTGLVRSDFYDWPNAISKLLQARSYHSVIMMIGANDCQAISEDGKIHKFGTTSWKDIYAKRLLTMADQLCSGGRKVYWITLPPMRLGGFNRRIKQLNALMKGTLALRPCIKILNLDRTLSNSGNYTSHIGTGKHRIKIREADGIHFTGKAGELVSRIVIESMNR